MRAYRLHEFSGPDGWKLDDLPSPTPGVGEVLIRVRAASINFRDLLVAKGIYNPTLKLPRIPVSDAAGEVVACGRGVSRFQPGDRVAANFMPGWVDGAINEHKGQSDLGGAAEGVLAEEVVLPETGLVRVSNRLSFEEAATLPCAGVTAWHSLFFAGAIKPGDTVLTLGTGGVSVFAVQFARLAGARVIATSSSDAKLSRVHQLGATDLINYKTQPDWEKTVRKLTGGVGVDVVVEVGGAGTFPRSLRAVRSGGTIALIGVLTGQGQIDPTSILMRSVKVQGIYVGSVAMFEAMNRAIEVGGIKPVIDRVFPFENAADALRLMESGSHFGKIVIHV
ncbi:MAG: NAD(P)-dependent alcohol dehydrogenase [Paludisphaera borealis]|uniref:zinc-dependent alcohol dehydrogenase family protein n=1 Tax=Paludisphaera borealis TaxID=1387353 RepID=UPI00283B499C|nr:NAD(P)-dependent alcohol dehydrogenase [Paludisphaera borealis]MDR3619817.1 NAD(P)-dependent alcohol dehydrogenase [Paludisphaera borealis]